MIRCAVRYGRLKTRPFLHPLRCYADQPRVNLRRLGCTFTALMRRVPHALSVISAPTIEGAQPKGLLVSSFTSVTVFPIPYVSFNIKVPSATLTAIDATRQFTASVIDSTITADVFAQITHKDEKLWEQILEPDGRLKEGFGGVAWMKCILDRSKTVDVGDHRVIIGEVIEAERYSDRHTKDSAMVYWQGKYARLGCGIITTEPGTGITKREGDILNTQGKEKLSSPIRYLPLDVNESFDGGSEVSRRKIRKVPSGPI